MKLLPVLAIVFSSLTLTVPVPAGDVFKANNTTALDAGGSWTGGVVPTASDVAVWDTGFNTTGQIGMGTAALSWAGIRVANPTTGSTIRKTSGKTITLGGSGIDMGAATQGFTLNCNVTVGSDQTWSVNSGKVLLLGDGIAGAGKTITKTGAGTLSLGGSSPYEPNFQLNGGVLQLGSGTVTLGGTLSGSGGTLLINTSGGTLTLAVANTFSGGTTLQAGQLSLKHAECLGTGALTITGGTLDNTSGGALTLSGNSPQHWNGSFTYVGSANLNLGATAITLANNPTVSVSANTLTVASAVTSAGSFTKGGAGTLELTSGSSLTLGGQLAVSGGLLSIGSGVTSAITGNTNLTGGSLTLAAGDLTTAGVVFGGTGTLALNAGVLTTGPISRTAGTATVAFNGGTLKAASESSTFLTGLSDATVGAAGAKIDTNGNSLTIAQPLLHDPALGATADGGLVLTGAGTLTLTGASTFTGPTIVTDGTLVLGTGGSLAASPRIELAESGGFDGGTTGTTLLSGQTLTGTGDLSGKITVGAGATLDPGTTAATGTFTGSADLTLAGITTFRVNKLGAVLTNDAVISNSVKYGGTLTVTVTGSALTAGNSIKLFDAGSYTGSFAALNLPDVSGSRLFWDTSMLSVDGTLTIVDTVPKPTCNPPAGSYFGAQSITISGIAGTTLYYTTDGSDPTTSGTVKSGPTPQPGILIPVNSTGFTLKAYASVPGFPPSGTASAVYNTVTAAVWTVDGSGDWSEPVNWLFGMVPDGGGISADFSTRTLSADTTVTLDGPRTIGNLKFGDVGNAFKWVLAGSTLTLDGAPVPVITVDNQATTVGVPLAGINGLIKKGAGTLTLGGTNTYPGETTVTSGTLALQNASASTAYSISSGAVLELDVATGTRDHPATGFSGTGTLRKTGAGSFVVGPSAGTFAMGAGALIDVQAGTLVAGSYANELWTADLADLNVASGAIFDAVEATSVANGGVFVDALTGSGTIKVGYGTAGSYASKITFGVDNGSGSFAGILADSAAVGSFVKAGSGTQTLGGACTYTGTTTVNGGALIVNGSLAAASAVTVAAGTLGGSGTVAGTVTAAGTLAPGASANTTGTLALGTTTLTGTYQCQLDGTSCDVIAVSGNLTLTGSALAVTALAGGAQGNYVIATYTGTRTGSFTTVPAGYAVDYSTPNQIKLTVEGASSGFASWVAGYGLTGTNALPAADPDRDGISNAVEFVVGGNPATGMDVALLPTMALVTNPGNGVPNGSYLKFTYRRTPASAYLNPVIEYDADLTGVWTSAGGAPQVVVAGFYTTPTPADKVEVYVLRTGNEVNGGLFGRLRVSVP